ncbi:MAG TPA: nitrilase-related carbon-nitrogen hydrolase, partial [Saprospiraceae bacterium]|nr:nitrilase-related carbon-nitrogen hydrolase [Saprospiraceae bacterium]
AVMATTIVASVAIEEHGNYFNRCYVASYGKIIARYDKRNCFTLAHEDKFYQSGDQHVVFQIKEWKIKPLICYDLRFPLWCYNHEDADILLFVANWPESRISHWDALLQVRAIENQAFVIGVNRVGLDGNNNRYNGHSSVITPYGNYQLGPLAESGVFGTQIDREEIVRYRKMFNLLAEERAKSGNDTK